jgi:hypothetical protein
MSRCVSDTYRYRIELALVFNTHPILIRLDKIYKILGNIIFKKQIKTLIDATAYCIIILCWKDVT